MRALVCRALAAVAISVTELSSAAAQPALTEPAARELATPAAVIDWQAPAACPDAHAFAARLGELMSDPPAEPARIRVRIAERSGHFVLLLRIASHAAAGERKLGDPSCAVVIDAAAFVAAMAIDPAAGQATAFRPAPTVTGIRDDEIPEPIVLGGAQGDVVRPARPGVAWFGLPVDMAVRIMAGGESGTMPGLAPTVHAAVTAQRGRWRVEVGGSHVLEQRAPMPDNPELGGHVSLSTGTLRGCADMYRGRVLASLCAGGELGWWHSTGYGVPIPLSESQLHAALSGGASIALQLLGPVHIRVDVQATGHLVRPRFGLCTAGSADECAVPIETFWQPAAIAARLLAGVEVAFR